MAFVNVPVTSVFLNLNSHISNAKVLGPISFDTATGNQFVVDLTNAVNQAQLSSGVQSVYIDASACNQNLIVTVNGSQQTFVIAPHTQGYYPISVLSAQTILTIFTNDFLSGDSGIINLYAYNVPMVSAQWNATPFVNKFDNCLVTKLQLNPPANSVQSAYIVIDGKIITKLRAFIWFPSSFTNLTYDSITFLFGCVQTGQFYLQESIPVGPVFTQSIPIELNVDLNLNTPQGGNQVFWEVVVHSNPSSFTQAIGLQCEMYYKSL